MKTIVMALAVVLSLSSCNAQEKEQMDKSLISKTENEKPDPRGTWKVNKTLDENGNLIRYDSTYTYSYGTIDGQEIAEKDMDSALTAFRKYMEEKMPQSFSRDIMAMPSMNDSIRNNFFEKGVFENHWEEFFPDIQNQLKVMDSLHQQFFQQARPGLFPDVRREREAEKEK